MASKPPTRVKINHATWTTKPTAACYEALAFAAPGPDWRNGVIFGNDRPLIG
jgi:hypothetical protein